MMTFLTVKPPTLMRASPALSAWLEPTMGQMHHLPAEVWWATVQPKAKPVRQLFNKDFDYR